MRDACQVTGKKTGTEQNTNIMENRPPSKPDKTSARKDDGSVDRTDL